MSKSFVFVARCYITPYVRAEGGAEGARIVGDWIVSWCGDFGVGIELLPCPEFVCPGGGYGRKPQGKKVYEALGLRGICTDMAVTTAQRVRGLEEADCTVIGFLMAEFSPSCAPIDITDGRNPYRATGIFVEELIAQGVAGPFIGFHNTHYKKGPKVLVELARQHGLKVVEDE